MKFTGLQLTGLQLMLLSALLVGTSVQAQPESQPQSREQFSRFMQTFYPSMTCKKTTFFRQCYLVTEELCREVMTEAVKECIEKQSHKIGSVLKQAIDVKYWQQMIGRCAGGMYNEALKQQRTHGQECENQSSSSDEPEAAVEKDETEPQ